MEKKNLFISNYSRIEQEVVKLSQYVDFCDEQLSVYSPVICDLLIRCGAEIESLCKEIYRRDVGKKLPKKVGLITKELDKIYFASRKVIILNNPCFNFSDFTKMKPFSYKPKDENDFYTLYCRLKHDRGENYHKATLKMLLLSLGGLYILNQLFLDKKIPIKNDFFGEDIPELLSESTEIFSVQVLNCNWDLVDGRFEKLKSETGLSNQEINGLKEKIFGRTGLRRNDYLSEECLYSIEFNPEYRKSIEAFNAVAVNDEIKKKTALAMMIGDEKDADELLNKYGVDALDSIISLFAAIGQKSRMRLCINKNNNGIVN